MSDATTADRKARRAGADVRPRVAATRRLLHLGCGRKRLEGLPATFHAGWEETRFDIDPGVEPDVLGDMTDLSALAPESFDAVWASHIFEHVYPHEAVAAVAQIASRLKPTGFLFASCPSLKAVCAFAAKHGLRATAYESAMGPISPLDMLYGHQGSIRAGGVSMAHKGGFDLDMLKDVFTKGGLPGLYGETKGFSIHMIGFRQELSLSNKRAALRHLMEGK